MSVCILGGEGGRGNLLIVELVFSLQFILYIRSNVKFRRALIFGNGWEILCNRQMAEHLHVNRFSSS